MMKLNKLPKINRRSKKRLGRGYGSGKGGHTVGRGAKGDKARGKGVLTFTGTKVKKSFLKKLPLMRGKGKFSPLQPGPVIVNIKYLNLLPKGSEVNLETLIRKKIVREKEAKRYGVKILGDGDLKVSLKVSLPCSVSAAKKIEKAGGKLIRQNQEAEQKRPQKRTESKDSKKKPSLSRRPRTKANK